MKKQKSKSKGRNLQNGQVKYDKIGYRQKMFLLKKIFIDKAQIKETSTMLGINYSTAKTFIRKYKASNASPNIPFICDVCNWFDQHSRIKERCSYKLIQEKSMEASSKGYQPEFVLGVQSQNRELNCSFRVKRQSQNLKARQIKIIQQVLFQKHVLE